MNKLVEILDQPFDFTVYLYEKKYVMELSFFSSVIDYTIFYSLDKEDERYLEDKNYFIELSKKIRNNKKFYENRIIPNSVILV